MKSTIDSSHKARSSTETGTINQRKNQITLSSSRLTTDSFIFQCVIETVQVVHGFLVFKALKVLVVVFRNHAFTKIFGNFFETCSEFLAFLSLEIWKKLFSSNYSMCDESFFSGRWLTHFFLRGFFSTKSPILKDCHQRNAATWEVENSSAAITKDRRLYSESGVLWENFLL